MIKKTADTKLPESRRVRVLPNDACPACGTRMIEKRSTLHLPIKGKEVSVPSARHLSCPKCGEVVLRYQDAKRLHEDAIKRS